MLNAEISLIIHDPDANAELVTIQQGYIDRSNLLTTDEWS